MSVKKRLSLGQINKVKSVLKLLGKLNLDALEDSSITPQQINNVLDSLLILSELKINSEVVMDRIAKQIRAGIDHLQTAIDLYEEVSKELP